MPHCPPSCQDANTVAQAFLPPRAGMLISASGSAPVTARRALQTRAVAIHFQSKPLSNGGFQVLPPIEYLLTKAIIWCIVLCPCIPHPIPSTCSPQKHCKQHEELNMEKKECRRNYSINVKVQTSPGGPGAFAPRPPCTPSLSPTN